MNQMPYEEVAKLTWHVPAEQSRKVHVNSCKIRAVCSAVVPLPPVYGFPAAFLRRSIASAMWKGCRTKRRWRGSKKRSASSLNFIVRLRGRRKPLQCEKKKRISPEKSVKRKTPHTVGFAK